MTGIRYNKLKVLVADDFSNFRNTVNGMLADLGVIDVDMASNCDEIIELCSKQRYKVILCDYNLGSGRTGQHVLEELRYRTFLRESDIFMLVSAESSRDIVLSAYDCTPDDYLMKPITTQMLHKRLERVLLQRVALGGAYQSLEKGDTGSAIDNLIEMSLAENRYSTAAQKMLGELFIQEQEYHKAEKLYSKALEVRPLEWARLGMARVKHFKGEHDTASHWLQKIIEDNYLYLPAYDVLADAQQAMGDNREAQEVVQKAVAVSPMSILRQKKLAGISRANGDLETAVQALRKAVKLGKQSCYGSAEDIFDLARTTSDIAEQHGDIPANLLKEVLEQLDSVDEHFELSGEALIKSKLNKSRLLALADDKSAAKAELHSVEPDMHLDLLDIYAAIDQVKALQALGDQHAVRQLLEQLKIRFADDEHALGLLDQFFDEPVSEGNKALVAKVNREGIELYNQGRFDEALECFQQVRNMFPKHIGLQLNIVQALIGKLKQEPSDYVFQQQCQDSLGIVASRIDQDHSQYKRYQQLRKMAKGLLNYEDNMAAGGEY